MLVNVLKLYIFCVLINSTELSTEKSAQTSTDIAVPTSTIETTTILESLNATLLNCDAGNESNCSQINGTVVPNNESAKVNDTAKIKPKEHQTKHSRNINICTCNLQVNSCDINCCCDPDCSLTDKNVFKFCEIDENRFVDDRYCNYMKYIYVNNTPFEWEVNQEGLFCVISTNLPKSHLIQTEEPITSFGDLKPHMPFWNDNVKHVKNKLQFLGSRNYEFGDSILIVKNDSSLDPLRISKSLLTGTCVFTEDVYFLKDDKSYCTQVNIDEENELLSLSAFFHNIKIIGKPKLVNFTMAKGNLYHNCPRNVCLEINAKLCDHQLNNCVQLTNTRKLHFKCSFDLRSNLNHCVNAASKIHYRFFHNGTNGLDKVEILGAIKNFSYHFGHDNFEFLQEHSIEFLWINQTKNYTKVFSGNPGYIVGKPILLANKLLVANSSLIQRNSSNFMNNFLVIPENIEGKCIRNQTFYHPIEFGFNEMLKCNFEKLLRYNANQSSTNICRNIQKNIFNLWGVYEQNNSSQVFGLFGNAVPLIETDWTDILYNIGPKTFLNNTQGNFTNRNSTLICHNISTLLNIEVFYSRVHVESVLNQNKILGISYTFSNIKNVSYLVQKKNNSIYCNITFNILNQVSFHDITSKKERKFVEAPSFHIRLPYDFFYPFIKVGNGSTFIMPSMFLIVLREFLMYICQ